MEKRRAGYRLELSFIIPKDKFKEFVEGQKKVGGREINEIGELSKGMYIRSIAIYRCYTQSWTMKSYVMSEGTDKKHSYVWAGIQYHYSHFISPMLNGGHAL